MSDPFDMTEIYAQQRRIEEAMLESLRQQAALEAFNVTFQALWALQCAQTLGLMYAGLNPNFCKPAPL